MPHSLIFIISTSVVFRPTWKYLFIGSPPLALRGSLLLLIDFYNQLTFFAPHLLQFLNASENLRFGSAKFGFFSDGVDVTVYPREGAEMYGLGLAVLCWHLDWQVSSMAQIINSLSQVFSAVEHLTFVHYEHNLSSEEHNEVDSTEWRRLLRLFGNVKTFRIQNGLVDDLSRCLQL